MKISDSVSLAFLDIKRRKIRTVLTVFALSVGTILLLLMLGAGDILQDKVKGAFAAVNDTNVITVMPEKYSTDPNMEVNVSMGASQNDKREMVLNKDKKDTSESFKKIDEETLKEFKDINGVKSIIASVVGEITSVEIEDYESKEKKLNLQGFNVDYDISKEEEIEYGTKLKNDYEVIIGEKALKGIGVEKSEKLIGKNIKLKLEFPKVNGIEVKESKVVEAKIVGIQKKSSDIVTSDKVVNDFMTYVGDGKDYLEEKGYNMVSITANEAKDITNITKDIREDKGYQAINMEEITVMIEAMMGTVKGVLSIAGIIVLIVGSFGLVNTMTMTIQERRQNIGVMKAVGATRGSIRWIYVIESAVISTIASIAGTIIAVIASMLAENIIGMKVPITSTNIVMAIMFSIIVGIIAGLLPAGRAAKLNVVDILSYE